jgi:hypothetical protein
MISSQSTVGQGGIVVLCAELFATEVFRLPIAEIENGLATSAQSAMGLQQERGRYVLRVECDQMTMKPLDPLDLRCGVCNKKIENNEERVAIVDHPRGKNQSMVVHCRHSGVSKVVKDPVQLTTGKVLQEVAWEFREELSPEEALKVISEQFGIDIGPKGNLIRVKREW